MVVPPNAEAWSLEASFAVATGNGEIRIPRANKEGPAEIPAALRVRVTDQEADW